MILQMTLFLQTPVSLMSKISTWMTLSLLMKLVMTRKTQAQSLIAPPHPGSPPEREEKGKAQVCRPLANGPQRGLRKTHPSRLKAQALLTQALCHQKSPMTHLSPPNPLPNPCPLPVSVRPPPHLLHCLLKPLPLLVRNHNRAGQNLQPKHQILHPPVGPGHPTLQVKGRR